MEDSHCFELAKTAMLQADPLWFKDRLVDELTYDYLGTYDNVACRLNGGSDLDWLDVIVRVPRVQFMDYTKVPKRMFDYLDGVLPSNYHLTFSKGSHNWHTCVKVLERGGNVAVVVRNKPRCGHDWFEWKGGNSEIIDGDEHDLRFRDPVGLHHGNIVVLSPKGTPAEEDTSGFVLDSLADLKEAIAY